MLHKKWNVCLEFSLFDIKSYKVYFSWKQSFLDVRALDSLLIVLFSIKFYSKPGENVR